MISQGVFVQKRLIFLFVHKIKPFTYKIKLTARK